MKTEGKCIAEACDRCGIRSMKLVEFTYVDPITGKIQEVNFLDEPKKIIVCEQCREELRKEIQDLNEWLKDIRKYGGMNEMRQDVFDYKMDRINSLPWRKICRFNWEGDADE